MVEKPVNKGVKIRRIIKWKLTSRNLLNLCLLLFRTSENAEKCSVFKGLRTLGKNAKVSYFIGKWCSLRQKWCSKWCSEIGTETSNIEIGNEVETHVFPEMEGHEFLSCSHLVQGEQDRIQSFEMSEL